MKKNEQLASLWQQIQDTALQNPDEPPYVRLARALALAENQELLKSLLPFFSCGETEQIGDCGNFAAGIDMDMWFSRIQVYANTAGEAEAIRDYLLGALAGASPRPMWLPMASAPDSRRILLCRPDGNHGMGRWEPQRSHRRPRPYWKDDRDVMGVDWMRANAPTGWMEVPQ